MWKCIVLFVAIASVYCDIYDICIRFQWEGIQTLLTGTQEGGKSTFIQTTGRVSFDSNNSRIAAFTSGSQDGGQFQRDYLFLYDKRVVYINEDGICHAESLTTGFPPICLPKDFNWTMWRTWYGYPYAQVWLFGYDGIVKDLKYSMQLILDIGVIGTQEIIGNLNGVPFFQTSQTVNTTAGIKNPDVFTVPSNCKTAEVKGNFTTPASLYGLFLP